MPIQTSEQEYVHNPVDGIPHLWSIVLAGGEGTRLAPMIKEW